MTNPERVMAELYHELKSTSQSRVVQPFSAPAIGIFGSGTV
jgi:hypothetical protein